MKKLLILLLLVPSLSWANSKCEYPVYDLDESLELVKILNNSEMENHINDSILQLKQLKKSIGTKEYNASLNRGLKWLNKLKNKNSEEYKNYSNEFKKICNEHGNEVLDNNIKNYRYCAEPIQAKLYKKLSNLEVKLKQFFESSPELYMCSKINNNQSNTETKNSSNSYKEALDGYLENEELKSAIDNSEYETSGSVKKLNENQNETDVYEGERKFSISWEGYKSTIGTLTFSSIQNTGSVNFILPANIKCTGTYALSELKGTWSILCNNDMSSTGTLKWNSSDDSVVGKGRDNENRSVEFFVEGY
jgi:hypothetical protein